MFGNRLGWSISAVIVLVTLWILYILAEQAKPTPATDLGRNAASYTVSFPTDPSSLAPWMRESFEPGPLYEQIIALYEADKHLYNASLRFASTTVPEAQRWSKIMEFLFKASASSRSTIFGAKPETILDYEPDNLKLQALKTAGQAAINFGLLHYKEGDKRTSQRYFEAVFALGAKLYYERLTLGELEVAQELLGQAAPFLGTLAKDAGQNAKAQAFETFSVQRVEYSKNHILPLLRAILVLDPQVGDLRALAADAGDALWRIEAVLALGRCKFSAPRFTDQQAARLTIETLTQSDDPRIRAAAFAARALTIEQFRRLR
jgi:hypothetical protein